MRQRVPEGVEQGVAGVVRDAERVCIHDFPEARVSAAMRSVCSTLGVAGGHEQHIGCYHHQNLWLAKLVTLENALFFCNLLPRLNLDFSANYVFRAVGERLFHPNRQPLICSTPPTL